jgi:hypothetical protein
MILEDNTRLSRKPIKDIQICDCFKLNDSPGSLYIKVDQLTVPGLASCLKVMNGKIELLETDLLVYPVKARLIIEEIQ